MLHEKTKYLGHKRRRIEKQGSALKNSKNSINRLRETEKQKRTLSLNFPSQEREYFHISLVCCYFTAANICSLLLFCFRKTLHLSICSLSTWKYVSYLVSFPKENSKRGRQICGGGEISFSIKREVVKEKQMCFLSKKIFGIASIFGSVFWI